MSVPVLPIVTKLLRCRSAAFLLLLGAVSSPTSAAAQLMLTHTEDAAPIPAGTLRFRITTGWTRFDERFTTSGTRSLGDEIAADSLGPRQFPLLLPVETGLKALTNNAGTRLTLGRLAAQSDVRTVTTPIALEFGVTRRLSIGLLLPVIQTRRSIHISVNADSTQRANVGFIPARTRTTAAAANSTVYSAFTRAADSLTTLLARCPSSPTASGCSAVNANVAAATAARNRAREFANAVQSGLGTDSASAVIAPRAGSTLAAAIESQRTALNASLQPFLGPTAGTSSSVFTAANDFSYIDLQGRLGTQGFLQGGFGGGLDSIHTRPDRIALGGVTFAARWMVMDRFQRDTLPPVGGWQSRLAVGAELRYEKLATDSARKLGAISPVSGSAVAVSSAMDIVRGRLGATIAGRYEKGFARTVQTSVVGDPEEFYPVPFFADLQRTPGDVINVDVTPRFLLGQWFALDGHYGFERTGAATYDTSPITPCPNCLADFRTEFTPNTEARVAHRAGFGIRYSTVDAYMRGVTRTPLEVSFTHLETITGNAGVAKLQRDQIQVRIYWALFGNH